MALTFATLAASAGPSGAESSSALLVCSRGPAGQRFHVSVTMPSSAPAGSIYAVRLDGVSSGKISHFGLNYIHDMTVDYVLPAGASYVEGSARVIEGIGTANVLAGLRLSHHAGVLTMVLPARVENGSEYTPPSVRFQLRAIGQPGTWAAVSLRDFNLTANAVVVGDVGVACHPAMSPYTLGTTLITTHTGPS